MTAGSATGNVGAADSAGRVDDNKLSHHCPRSMIRQTGHALWHLCYLAMFQHPRAYYTYMWEDLMGKLFHISKACAIGTPQHRVSEKTMENFSIVALRALKDARGEMS